MKNKIKTTQPCNFFLSAYVKEAKTKINEQMNKVMKAKIVFAVIAMATAVLATSCHVKVNKTVTHSKVTKTYSGSAVKPFDRIIIDAFCDVRYVQGDSTSVAISYADPKDFAALDIKNQDGRFVIGYKTSHKVTRLKDDEMLKVVITTPDLIEVEMNGAGVFWSGNPIDTDTLLLQMKGAGKIEMGSIVCDRLQAELKGAGKIKLGPVAAQDCVIELKGVGKVDADFERCDKIDANIMGVGKVKLSGHAKKYDAHIMGTGKIDHDELVVD